MSKNVNPTVVGLFIVSGLALGVAGLLLFGSSRLFSSTLECIAYFDQSLNGLDEGAPVKYRGVTIGTVKRVMVRFNQATNDYAMPVILELQPKLMKERLGDDPGEFLSERALATRIPLGLRASLQTESFVTGLLYVDIRFSRRAPPPAFHQLEKRYAELPTEPTQIQQFMSNLASLDIKSVETNLNLLIRRLDSSLGTKLDPLLGKLDAAVTDLQTAQISRGITNLLEDLAVVRSTLEQYRALGERLERRIDPLADSVTHSLAEADRALGQVRGAAENLRLMLAPESTERHDFDLALQQLAGAAQSIATLVDFLKQHPNALITGRELRPKKP